MRRFSPLLPISGAPRRTTPVLDRARRRHFPATRFHAARRVRSLAAIVIAICGAAVTIALARNSPGIVARRRLRLHRQPPGPACAVLAFLLFARFRYADVFIRYGVRILLAGFWATLLAFTAQSAVVMHVAQHASAPAAMHVFVVILLANAFLLSFTFVDERLTASVIRWLFREPDYRAALRSLAAALQDVRSESEVGLALEEAARGPLELNGARWLALDATPASLPRAAPRRRNRRTGSRRPAAPPAALAQRRSAGPHRPRRAASPISCWSRPAPPAPAW